MTLHQTVTLAIKDKAPELFRQLTAKGELNQYVKDLVELISTQTVDLTQAQRIKEKWDKLGPMECAAKMKMAAALNKEIAMADLLEFPQEDTDDGDIENDPAFRAMVGPPTSVASNAYVVMVDDNFRYMDQSARWIFGSFTTLESAIQACKRLVDLCLDEYFAPGISAEGLLSQYKNFGDDPFIIGAGDGVKFSAWDYAALRCQVITGAVGEGQ